MASSLFKKISYFILTGVIWTNSSLFPSPAELEIGIRAGAGFKGKDRFDRSLGSFKGNVTPGVVNAVTLERAKYLNFAEGFFKKRIVGNHKMGFAFGGMNFRNFGLREINTLYEFTSLDFSLNTRHFAVTYHYEQPFRGKMKNFSLEGGLGLGPAFAELFLAGYRLSPLGLSSLDGYLNGSGLHYRLDGSLNYRFAGDYSFQTGVLLATTSIGGFDGNLDDGTGALYLRSDGSVTTFNNSEFTNYTYTNQNFARRLDMLVTTFVMYFSVVRMF